MKTKLSLLAAFMFAVISFSYAQQNAPRRTVDERVQAALEKMSALNLDAQQQEKTIKVFKIFYTDQAKMREEARSSGNRPDRSVFQKMTADRDEQLKAIFSAEQFKRYKVEVEPSMRPQRRGNGDGSSII